jgi:putative Mg2+ transporter-C (MgtC) family protein
MDSPRPAPHGRRRAVITPGTVVIRLSLALLLGALIGVEREHREHTAGLKTLSLVSLGSALITVASTYGFESALSLSSEMRLDPSHVAAQIVSGIGFLGAGAILLRKDLIRGLTTAAAIWLVAGIGLACGAGLLFEAGFATLCALVLLVVVTPVERRLFPRRTAHVVQLRLESGAATGRVVEQIYAIFGRLGLPIDSIETHCRRHNQMVGVCCRAARIDTLMKAVAGLHDIPGVQEVRASFSPTRGRSDWPENGAPDRSDASHPSQAFEPPFSVAP